MMPRSRNDPFSRSIDDVSINDIMNMTSPKTVSFADVTLGSIDVTLPEVEYPRILEDEAYVNAENMLRELRKKLGKGAGKGNGKENVENSEARVADLRKLRGWHYHDFLTPEKIQVNSDLPTTSPTLGQKYKPINVGKLKLQTQERPKRQKLVLEVDTKDLNTQMIKGRMELEHQLLLKESIQSGKSLRDTKYGLEKIRSRPLGLCRECGRPCAGEQRLPSVVEDESILRHGNNAFPKTSTPLTGYSSQVFSTDHTGTPKSDDGNEAGRTYSIHSAYNPDFAINRQTYTIPNRTNGTPELSKPSSQTYKVPNPTGGITVPNVDRMNETFLKTNSDPDASPICRDAALKLLTYVKSSRSDVRLCSCHSEPDSGACSVSESEDTSENYAESSEDESDENDHDSTWTEVDSLFNSSSDMSIGNPSHQRKDSLGLINVSSAKLIDDMHSMKRALDYLRQDNNRILNVLLDSDSDSDEWSDSGEYGCESSAEVNGGKISDSENNNNMSGPVVTNDNDNDEGGAIQTQEVQGDVPNQRDDGASPGDVTGESNSDVSGEIQLEIPATSRGEVPENINVPERMTNEESPVMNTDNKLANTVDGTHEQSVATPVNFVHETPSFLRETRDSRFPDEPHCSSAGSKAEKIDARDFVIGATSLSSDDSMETGSDLAVLRHKENYVEPIHSYQGTSSSINYWAGEVMSASSLVPAVASEDMTDRDLDFASELGCSDCGCYLAENHEDEMESVFYCDEHNDDAQVVESATGGEVRDESDRLRDENPDDVMMITTDHHPHTVDDKKESVQCAILSADELVTTAGGVFAETARIEEEKPVTNGSGSGESSGTSFGVSNSTAEICNLSDILERGLMEDVLNGLGLGPEDTADCPPVGTIKLELVEVDRADGTDDLADVIIETADSIRHADDIQEYTSPSCIESNPMEAAESETFEQHLDPPLEKSVSLTEDQKVDAWMTALVKEPSAFHPRFDPPIEIDHTANWQRKREKKYSKAKKKAKQLRKARERTLQDQQDEEVEPIDEFTSERPSDIIVEGISVEVLESVAVVRPGSDIEVIGFQLPDGNAENSLDNEDVATTDDGRFDVPEDVDESSLPDSSVDPATEPTTSINDKTPRPMIDDKDEAVVELTDDSALSRSGEAEVEQAQDVHESLSDLSIRSSGAVENPPSLFTVSRTNDSRLYADLPALFDQPVESLQNVSESIEEMSEKVLEISEAVVVRPGSDVEVIGFQLSHHEPDNAQETNAALVNLITRSQENEPTTEHNPESTNRASTRANEDTTEPDVDLSSTIESEYADLENRIAVEDNDNDALVGLPSESNQLPETETVPNVPESSSDVSVCPSGAAESPLSLFSVSKCTASIPCTNAHDSEHIELSHNPDVVEHSHECMIEDEIVAAVDVHDILEVDVNTLMDSFDPETQSLEDNDEQGLEEQTSNLQDNDDNDSIEVLEPEAVAPAVGAMIRAYVEQLFDQVEELAVAAGDSDGTTDTDNRNAVETDEETGEELTLGRLIASNLANRLRLEMTDLEMMVEILSALVDEAVSSDTSNEDEDDLTDVDEEDPADEASPDEPDEIDWELSDIHQPDVEMVDLDNRHVESRFPENGRHDSDEFVLENLFDIRDFLGSCLRQNNALDENIYNTVDSSGRTDDEWNELFGRSLPNEAIDELLNRTLPGDESSDENVHQPLLFDVPAEEQDIEYIMDNDLTYADLGNVWFVPSLLISEPEKADSEPSEKVTEMVTSSVDSPEIQQDLNTGPQSELSEAAGFEASCVSDDAGSSAQTKIFAVECDFCEDVAVNPEAATELHETDSDDDSNCDYCKTPGEIPEGETASALEVEDGATTEASTELSHQVEQNLTSAREEGTDTPDAPCEFPAEDAENTEVDNTNVCNSNCVNHVDPGSFLLDKTSEEQLCAELKYFYLTRDISEDSSSGDDDDPVGTNPDGLDLSPADINSSSLDATRAAANDASKNDEIVDWLMSTEVHDVINETLSGDNVTDDAIKRNSQEFIQEMLKRTVSDLTAENSAPQRETESSNSTNGTLPDILKTIVKQSSQDFESIDVIMTSSSSDLNLSESDLDSSGSDSMNRPAWKLMLRSVVKEVVRIQKRDGMVRTIVKNVLLQLIELFRK